MSSMSWDRDADGAEPGKHYPGILKVKTCMIYRAGGSLIYLVYLYVDEDDYSIEPLWNWMGR